MTNAKWNKDKIISQEGRVVIVTGSSSGIGLEAAKVLAEKGATVIIAVRNPEKGDKALNTIKAQHPGTKAEVILLDLADLASVKQFNSAFREKYDRLDLLINNAGVMIPPYSKTKDGFELQFGTNHLGHFALTMQLLDLLDKTPDARIVNVSSMAHNYGNLDFDDLNWEKRKYKPSRAYGDSKIANLYFTFELQRRLQAAGSKLLVTAAHPGWTATDLQRHSSLFEFLNTFFAMKTWQGALPTLRAATDPDAAPGDYYGPDGFMEWRGFPTKVGVKDLARDEQIAKRLWQVSEEWSGQKFALPKENKN